MKIPFFDTSRVSQNYQKELEEALLKTLKEGKYINGPEVKELENQLSKYVRSSYCISCANGTDALTLALRVLEIPKSSEVILPSFNYVSSAECVVNLGLRPVFCDVERETFNTSLKQIKEKISPKTRVVIITHLFGATVSEVKEIASFCKSKGLFLIEDNAQSFGSKIGNQFSGTFGDIGTTSFFPTKNLGCMGDGGAIFTNNQELAEKLRCLKSHGQGEKYEFKSVGYNSRLDTMQASLLLVKLNYLESQLKERKENALTYTEALKDLESIATPLHKNNTFNQYTIRAKKRDELKQYLDSMGIGSTIYYPNALHKQPAYKKYCKEELNNSIELCNECLSLPIYPGLRREEILYICKKIQEFNQ